MTNIEQEVRTFGNPPITVEDVIDERGETYCQIHTDVATALRCNNCTRLMCAKCAVRTPVGYRCQQCVRQQEDRFFDADTAYYAKIIGITVVLSGVGAFVAALLGWIIFVIFVGIAAAGMISEVVFRFTKGKRGRYAAQAAAGGVIAGTMLFSLVVFQILIPPLPLLIYMGIVAVGVYGRFNIYGRKR